MYLVVTGYWQIFDYMRLINKKLYNCDVVPLS